MTKSMTVLGVLGFLICVLLSFAMQDGVGALSSEQIEKVKMWNLGMEVMRWNWVIPFVMSVALIFIGFTFWLERQRENLLKSKSYTASFMIAVVMLTGVQFVTWLQFSGHVSQGASDNFIVSMSVLGLIVLGNYISTARKSWFSGLPTPWAMKSDLAWGKMHRLLGRGITFISLGLGVSFLIMGPQLLNIKIWFVLFATLIIVSTIYSCMVWRKDPNREEFGKRKA